MAACSDGATEAEVLWFHCRAAKSHRSSFGVRLWVDLGLCVRNRDGKVWKQDVCVCWQRVLITNQL